VRSADLEEVNGAGADEAEVGERGGHRRPVHVRTGVQHPKGGRQQKASAEIGANIKKNIKKEYKEREHARPQNSSFFV
jgi:hypothetical protein